MNIHKRWCLNQWSMLVINEYENKNKNKIYFGDGKCVFKFEYLYILNN